MTTQNFHDTLLKSLQKYPGSTAEVWTDPAEPVLEPAEEHRLFHSQRREVKRREFLEFVELQGYGDDSLSFGEVTAVRSLLRKLDEHLKNKWRPFFRAHRYGTLHMVYRPLRRAEAAGRQEVSLTFTVYGRLTKETWLDHVLQKL